MRKQTRSCTICEWLLLYKNILHSASGEARNGKMGAKDLVETIDAGLRSIYNAVALEGHLNDSQFEEGIRNHMHIIEQAIKNARLPKDSGEWEDLEQVIGKWHHMYTNISARGRESGRIVIALKAAMDVFSQVNNFCSRKRSNNRENAEKEQGKWAKHSHHREDAMDTSAPAASSFKNAFIASKFQQLLLMPRCQRCSLCIEPLF